MTGTEFSGREIHENRGGWVGLHPERLLFFLVLSCLITPQRVLAQALCSEPVVTLEYDCSTVPEESPSGAWSIVDSETYDSTWHSDGNNLYLDACATHGSAVFYRVEESLATAEKMAIEVRAYVTCHVTTTWLPGIFLGFGISDGTKLVLVWPVGSLEEGRIGVNYSGNYFQSEPGATDWSMPATYRLVLDKSSADPAVHVATVLVNGVTVLTVPYDELDDVGTLPYEIASPHLFGIGANNSDTVWDRVGYEICEQQATPEPPPIEEQITNMQEAAEFLDAPRPVHLWLQGHLEHAGQIDDPLEQGQAFYRIGRQFFMMKFAGVVAGDAAEFETLLDFARDTVAPEIERQEGYLGKLYINSALVKTPYVVPGRESAHLRVFASLKPAGKHINNPDGDIFGLKARVSVINITTGDVVRVQESLQQLPDRLPPGEIYRAAALDFFWDGQKDDGTRAVPGESYFIDATVEYVDFGEDISMIPQPLDGAMIVFRPDIELYDISEVSAGRSFLGTATKVTDETVDLGNGGRFFIHTENLSQSSDPVIHVLEPSTGVQQAANDDCETTLSLPCVDDNENEINCPDIQGTKNACVLVDSGLVKNYALRIVVHANANHLQGSGDLVIWKRVATDSLGSAYKRISVNSNQSFGGTRIRFISGWYGGDEMDLIIPSPERCRDEIGEDFSPAHVPGSLYLLASTTEITDSRSGNIMAGGALIWYLNQTNEGLVMVGSASPVGSFETGVALYVNDYLNDDFDGDGLGRELENEIGTNPGSESGPPGEGRDTDGDGIWDGFEVLGIRTGDTGYPEQALPTWGADPRHKDVFIESDLFYNCDGDRAICPVSECGSRLTGNAAMVVGDVASKCSGGAGFLNNPDGRNGFSIHIDSGLNNMEEPVNSVYGSWGGSNTIYRPEAGVKPSYDQLMRDSWHNDLYFNRIRRGIFRYSIGTPSGQNLWASCTICG